MAKKKKQGVTLTDVYVQVAQVEISDSDDFCHHI